MLNAWCPTSVSGGTWTVMVYMAGDNSCEPYVTEDLNALEAWQGDGVNVAVIADRSEGYSSDDGDWTDTRQAVLTADFGLPTTSLTAATSVGELNMGDAQTLTDFINWAAAAAPADNYALFFWNHGAGLAGVCSDDPSRDLLTLPEVSSAIAGSDVEAFDLVGFDACNMGMTEVAYQLEGLTDVMLASQDYVPWDGYDYQSMMQTLATNPTVSAADLGVSMVDDYVQWFGPRAFGITQSAIDVNALSGLESALDAFVWQAEAGSDWDLDQLAQAAGQAHDFTPGYPDNQIDLADFMNRVAASLVNPDLAAAASSVAAELDRVVLAEGGTVRNAGGLSIYLPTDPEMVALSYSDETYGFLKSVDWDSFLTLI